MTHDHLINRIVDELQGGGITGWCSVQKALELATAVIALRPKIVLETGVWGGRSLLPMALACEAVGSGVVIGIDPWSPQASTEGYDGANSKWWGEQDHERVYQSFMGHVDRLGLKNRVAIERAKSDDAMVPESIDLCHLDSQHTGQATREVHKYASRVRLGGIVVMDDVEWHNDGVKSVAQAIIELLKIGFVELHRTVEPTGCNWGFFQRIEKLSLPTNSTKSQPARRGARGAVAASNSNRGART